LPLQAYFALVVGLFVVTAVAAALYVHVQAGRDARRDARSDAAFAARTASKQLGDFIALVQATAKQLAANPQITQAFSNPKACSLSFAGLAGPDNSRLDVIRPDGGVACSSRAAAEGGSHADYASASWLSRAQKSPALIAPVLDTATGAQAAIGSAPIPGNKGIVAGFVDLTSVGPELAALYSGGHPVEFLVTSSDGSTVIARSIDPKRWVGSSLAGTAFARAGDAVDRRDLEGRSRLYGRATVPATGWRFYVGEDKTAALSAGRRLERRQLEIILAGLVAVLLAALVAYRRVATPIRELSAAVRSSGAQTPRLPVPARGPAEVAALAGDLNALISSVNHELLERQRAESVRRRHRRHGARRDDHRLERRCRANVRLHLRRGRWAIDLVPAPRRKKARVGADPRTRADGGVDRARRDDTRAQGQQRDRRLPDDLADQGRER
jgi:HAMP domain-containing protein